MRVLVAAALLAAALLGCGSQAGGLIWIANQSEQRLIVRTDYFGEPHPRTVSYSVEPRSNGVVGAAPGGATVLVLDAETCDVLGRWEGPEQRLGIRVTTDGEVIFLARESQHVDSVPADPLPTAPACVPAP